MFLSYLLLNLIFPVKKSINNECGREIKERERERDTDRQTDRDGCKRQVIQVSREREN